MNCRMSNCNNVKYLIINKIMEKYSSCLMVLDYLNGVVQ